MGFVTLTSCVVNELMSFVSLKTTIDLWRCLLKGWSRSALSLHHVRHFDYVIWLLYKSRMAWLNWFGLQVIIFMYKTPCPPYGGVCHHPRANHVTSSRNTLTPLSCVRPHHRHHRLIDSITLRVSGVDRFAIVRRYLILNELCRDNIRG